MLHALNRAEGRRLQNKRKARDARLQVKYYEAEVEKAKAALPDDLEYVWVDSRQEFVLEKDLEDE